MTPTTPSDKQGRSIQVISLLHFLIAAVVLVAAPAMLNELLSSVFFSRSYMWVRQGELPGWPITALDEFFFATPYWTSYQPGWFLGLLPGLLIALFAWGLWNRHRWAKQLGMGLWGLVAFAAACVAIGSTCYCLANLGGGGPDSLAGVAVAIFAIVGGIALGVFLLSGGLLWWLRRVSKQTDTEAIERTGIGNPVLCCVAVLCAAVVLEVAYNRMSVYHGDATYQGQWTGDWLRLLASRNAETRRAAMQQLGKSEDSVPILVEIYRGTPQGRDRRACADKIERVYWSRAHTALQHELRRENLIGRPLTLALDELAQDADPAVRRAALQIRTGLFREAPETLTAVLNALRDEDPVVRDSALNMFAYVDEKTKQSIVPQLRELAQAPQLDPKIYRIIIRWVDPEEAARIAQQEQLEKHRELVKKIPEYVEQLTHGTSRSRRQAAGKLGELGEDAAEAIPALMAVLNDSDPWVRCSAAGALGKIGPAAKDAIPLLVTQLQSDDRTRWAAASALGTMGPVAKLAVPNLLTLLKDDNTHTRVVAAEALYSIDGQADVVTPVLREALKAKDYQYRYTRVRAAEALWGIERQIDAVFPTLRKATTNKEAGRALKRIAADCVTADEKRALALCYIRHAPLEKQNIALLSYQRAAELLTAIQASERTAADWGWLGQALYHVEQWDDARRALERANELRNDTEPTLSSGPRWWYLTLTLARLGENEKARAYYERLVEDMEKNTSQDLRRYQKLRSEAAQLLGVSIE